MTDFSEVHCLVMRNGSIYMVRAESLYIIIRFLYIQHISLLTCENFLNDKLLVFFRSQQSAVSSQV